MSNPESGQLGPPPTFNFTIDNCLGSWNVSMREWLSKNDKHWDGLATGNLVFNEDGNLLIIQRASHDSMPNRWEIPGGAADDEDPNLFYSAARELWEEAGLKAKRFTHVVTQGPDREPGDVFTNRTGTRLFCRFSFNVEVENSDHVRLDPNEHQNFAWVTEDQVRQQRIGEMSIPITNQNVQSLMLEAFRLKKEKSTSQS